MYKPPSVFSIHIIQWYYSIIIIIIIIIDVGVSANAVAGSLAWIRMRHATCTRRARWSLEEVLNMPEQFDSRSQPLSLSVCENWLNQ